MNFTESSRDRTHTESYGCRIPRNHRITVLQRIATICRSTAIEKKCRSTRIALIAQNYRITSNCRTAATHRDLQRLTATCSDLQRLVVTHSQLELRNYNDYENLDQTPAGLTKRPNLVSRIKNSRLLVPPATPGANFI